MTIEELDGETAVTISAGKDIDEGDYSLHLDSFDSFETVYYTLKTDIIALRVKEREVPAQIINVGAPSSWSIPDYSD